MPRASWLKKIWNGRSKGVSTVIGTVFLMLIIFMVSTNVLLWTFSQNAQYNQEVKAVNQEEADRHNENVVATDGDYSVSGNEVTVETTLTNAGSVAAQIINLWVFDTSIQTYNYTSLSLNLNPGNVANLTGENAIVVTVDGADSAHDFISWFVTARGNTIPLEEEQEQGVIIAELAQGIGYLAMDFTSFKYYEVTDDDELEPPQSGFSIPSKDSIVFRLILTNFDESHRNINLTAQSLLWLYSPVKKAQESWIITKVVDQTLEDFNFQILPFGEPTEVFFGPSTATQLAGSLCAANLLLYGTIGGSDYGQNIPFVAVYVQA